MLCACLVTVIKETYPGYKLSAKKNIIYIRRAGYYRKMGFGRLAPSQLADRKWPKWQTNYGVVDV